MLRIDRGGYHTGLGKKKVPKYDTEAPIVPPSNSTIRGSILKIIMLILC